jgi:hypothetical protein
MPRHTSDAVHYKVRSTAQRLPPPRELTPAERRVWISIVSDRKPEHFVASDTPLLSAYVRACVMEATLARKISKDAKALLQWERTIKSMVLLSMRLRLSPQSRTPTNQSARSSPTLEQQQATKPSNYYDQLRLQNGDDDDDHERAH